MLRRCRRRNCEGSTANVDEDEEEDIESPDAAQTASAVEKEAEGYKLFLSSNNATGYKSVSPSLEVHCNGRSKWLLWPRHARHGGRGSGWYAKHMAEKGIYPTEKLPKKAAAAAFSVNNGSSRETWYHFLDAARHDDR